MRPMNQKLITSFEELTGRTDTHLTLYKDKIFLHPEALLAFNKLKIDAKNDGYDLEIISGFRSYDRQLLIWNNKVSKSTLAPLETLESIMKWSALPGASRHHWGSDIDIFDAYKADKKDVQLEIFEYESNGIFFELNNWLTKKINNNEAYGFYRPYDKDRGGISPEPWHLSYSPISQINFKNYSLEIFRKNISESDLLLKNEIQNNLTILFERFFQNIKTA